MHNSFWGAGDGDWDADGFSTCRVAGYVGEHKFSSGVSKHTYVIECEGAHYAARHSAVAGALADPAVKRRVRKSGNPRRLR